MPGANWKLEVADPFSSSSAFFYREALIFKPVFPTLFSQFAATVNSVEEQLGFSIDIVNSSDTFHLPVYKPLDFPSLSPLDLFERTADLLQIERSSALQLLREREETGERLWSLADRVAALEIGFGQAHGMNAAAEKQDRRYEWTAEFKGPKDGSFDRKYKCVAEGKSGAEKSVKWTAEIKGKGRNESASRKYTFLASTAPPGAKGDAVKKNGEEKKAKQAVEHSMRVVEIDEPVNPKAIVLKQAFAKRITYKGKRKELLPQDAALVIQLAFRAHLVRRSQALRALRDLAVAKARLREIRAAFSNFSYRCRIEQDAEEQQRFSEKIIVVLLTVDAIEGLDYIIRAAKRSMVTELEAILEVVDPQPPGRLHSIKRRQFDLPSSGSISSELAHGVEKVVQLIEHDN